MKKFLAITLTLALTLALFAFPIPANAAVTTQTETNVLFEDDFGDYTDRTEDNIQAALTQKGWSEHNKSRSLYALANGSYVVPDGDTSYLTIADQQGEYSVQVNVSFSSVPQTRTADSYAVVVLNGVTGNAGGYEFGLLYSENGQQSVVLRRRAYSGLCNGIVYERKTQEIAIDQSYVIRLTYSSGILYGYVGDVCVITHNTAFDKASNDGEETLMLTSGVAGFRKIGADAQVSFDNFKVEKTEKTVWFSEDFSYESADAMQATGWDSVGSMYNRIQNGSLSLIADAGLSVYTMQNAKGITAWADYTVESDFTITRNESGSRQWFGLTGRMINGNGYEFAILVGSESNGHIDARIRSIDSKNTEHVKASNAVAYTDGATYKLKVEFIGNTINGYINGELVCTYTDEANTFMRGAAGYSAQKGANGDALNAVVDNFKVTKYNPYTEYFNQTFDNGTTAESLTDAGYSAVGTDMDMSTMATYLNNGKLSWDNDKKALGLFSPYINSNTYTVQTEVVIDTAPSSAAYPCGLLIGSSNKTYASGYYFDAQSDKNGNIVKIRVRKNGTNVLSAIDLSSSISKGDTALLKAGVSYDATTEKTTVTVSVSSGDTVRGTGSFTVDGELQGYAATWKNAAGGVSFDNFTAYNVNSYVSPTIGELDGDGIVTAADGRYIREYLLGLNDATAADLNADAESDIRDLVHFKKVFEFYR